jgi:hypothetical protein
VAVNFLFFRVDTAELAVVHVIALAGVCWSYECYVRALPRQLLTAPNHSLCRVTYFVFDKLNVCLNYGKVVYMFYS